MLQTLCLNDSPYCGSKISGGHASRGFRYYVNAGWFYELCTLFDFSSAIQILLNGTSVIENATITGFSVVPAAPPIAPSPPFIPPEFENATINGEPVLTPVEEVTTPPPPPTTGEGESVRYTIPAAMRVTMEPQEEVATVCTII